MGCTNQLYTKIDSTKHLSIDSTKHLSQNIYHKTSIELTVEGKKIEILMVKKVEILMQIPVQEEIVSME